LVATPLALSAVLVTQWSSVFFRMAFWPLTESLFMLCMGIALLTLVRMTDSERVHDSLAAGLCCAAVFLSRQIGLLWIFGALGWLIIVYSSPGKNRRIGLRLACGLVLGFTILIAPYAVALYAQTGQHPLKQGFRWGHYSIEVGSDATARELQNLRDFEPKNYFEEYSHRRRLRHLTPEASEMYSKLVDPAQPAASILDAIASQPLQFLPTILPNFWRNLTHLQTVVGWPLTFALFLSAAAVVFSAIRQRGNTGLIIPWFLGVYIVGLSVATGLVDRYLFVLVPLCSAQIAVGVWSVILPLERTGGATGWKSYIAAAGMVVCGLVSQSGFWNVQLTSPFPESSAELAELTAVVSPGDSAFSLFPMQAYLIGAQYRILPNDRLNRVIEYGRRTGVRWLIRHGHPSIMSEIRLYDRAGWYLSPRLHGLPLRATTSDGLLELYEILPQTEASH
jgi:hypothetical protein